MSTSVGDIAMTLTGTDSAIRGLGLSLREMRVKCVQKLRDYSNRLKSG